MTTTPESTFSHISIDVIHAHNDHIRPLSRESQHDQWLIDSVEALGILMPLVVMEEEPGLYRIVDGHRRYFAACQLGLNALPCVVRRKLSRGEYELLRYRLQNGHKPWTQAERREAAKRLRECDDEES